MGMVVKLVLGVVLFVASLVGGLAATGRLNHEGTANIPVLSGFFPPPPPPAEGEGVEGEKKEGEATDAAHHGDAGAPVDAHAAPGGETHGTPAEATAGGEQDPQKPIRQKDGKSVVEPEKPKDGGGGHGGGHGGGEEPAAEGHGKPDAHGKADAHGKTDEHAKSDAHGKTDEHGKSEHGSPEGDFQGLQKELEKDKSPYKPGELFRFDGLPSGLSIEQINDAWQRVQGLMSEVEQRKTALDIREKDLQELANDISKRQAELGQLRARLDEMQRSIDAKIQKFQDQVKLVRNDEVAGLKRNAATLASFEPAKAAEIVLNQWGSEKGQDEVLRLFEFMDKDAVNEILKLLPAATTQDVMKKRLRVSKESAAPPR